MKKLLLSIVILFSASFAFAQGKYGADSAECVKYLSFYQQYVKQGNLEEAAPSWRKAISLCPPTASQNMLMDGMKILRKEINTYKNNPIRKKELVDSLMWLHSLRIENYPRYVVTAKTNYAVDMMNYSEKGSEMEVYNVLADAMATAKEKSTVAIPVRYMHYAIDLYNSGKLTEEDVLNSFQTSVSVLESIQKAKPSDMVTNAIADVENLFAQSGVVSCEGLVNLFEPRYNSNPEDKSVLTAIVSLFSSTNCTEEVLFRNAVEGLHKIEPSSNSAYLLYKLYAGTPEGATKAVEYMQQAVELENTNENSAASYQFELATYYFQKLGKNAEAIAAAKSAAELSDEYKAKAYFLIGTIWSTIKCQGNEIETRAPFWVATDYMIKAKNADPSLASEADIHISSYRKYYPMQADAFMYDIVDGDSFSISCGGLRETTTVRTQK
ncbi:MAG: hypothetical protein J6U71_03535 [Bacteroidales bacterium]|nr:hypothetical protein [Bacteroidales bacterium]MBO7284118.1 hypothetical protein [Bacteroidales bacterium]